MSSSSNASNKHDIRTKFKDLLINDIKLSSIEATDLEIGVFNATIDYANSLKIPLSWASDLFIDSYLNIARSIYSNLDINSYVKNENIRTSNKLLYLSNVLGLTVVVYMNAISY